ncbi:MAG: transcriptional regulator [Priestia megaterium]
MKLSRHDIQKLEDYWINLEDYKRQMRHRERDLIEGWLESDTNIGGGKANRISDTTGNKATILADDVMLQNLKRIVHTIESLYKELDNDQKTIVDMRYWDQKNHCYEWEDIADRLYMSRNKVLRKRNALIKETAKRTGWV